MSRQIAQSSIVNSIIGGIEDANKFYEKCSGGAWLNDAPESLICTSIAQRLNELEGPKTITLEASVRDTLSLARANGKGPLKKILQGNGRYDLILWRGNDTPRAIIEVKRYVASYSQIKRDVDRIVASLQKNPDCSSLQFGSLAFYTWNRDNPKSNAKEVVRKRIERLVSHTEENVPSGITVSVHCGKTRYVDGCAWSAACIVLKRQR